MKKGTWVQIVFYRGHRRFVARGKLSCEYKKKYIPYIRPIELESVIFLNGYVMKGHEGAYANENAFFIPSQKVIHIRKLSKDVALAMEL